MLICPLSLAFGGQRYHNLFVDMQFIDTFALIQVCESVLMFLTQNWLLTI